MPLCGDLDGSDRTRTASSEDAQKRPANTLARNRKDLVAQGFAALRKLELDSDRHERDGAVHGSHLFGRP